MKFILLRNFESENVYVVEGSDLMCLGFFL